MQCVKGHDDLEFHLRFLGLNILIGLTVQMELKPSQLDFIIALVFRKPTTKCSHTLFLADIRAS